MSRPLFTPEELEEMRISDEEIEKEVDAEFSAGFENKEIDKWLDELVAADQLDHKQLHQKRQRRKYSAAYRETHKEELAAKMAAYCETHKEELAAKKAAYYETHKEELAAKMAAYRETHKEELAAKKAAYRETHKEELAAKKAAYRETHKEELLDYQRCYRESHRKGQRRRVNVVTCCMTKEAATCIQSTT